MTTLADDIKRLREVITTYDNAATYQLLARNALQTTMYPEAIRTINALVELVGEMHVALQYYSLKRGSKINFGTGAVIEFFDGEVAMQAITKAAPIAALAKGE